MPSNRFPCPSVAPVIKQHEVADLGTAGHLMKAIPDKPELLSVLRGCHVAAMEGFDPALLAQLFRQAASFESDGRKATSTESCKVLGGNFLDTRRPEVRLVFQRAWQGLGGSFIDLSEAVGDILRHKRDPSEIAALNNNYCDFAVVSTTHAELLPEMLKYSRVPLINAGNGEDEAPTQALADLYALFKWRPELLQKDPPAERRLRVGIVGTPATTGTLRSLLSGLALFPQIVDEIILLDRVAVPFKAGQREALQQAGLRIRAISEIYPHDTVMGSLGKVVPDLDLIYSHLKQRQSVSRMDMLELKGHFKPNLLLLSPQRQLTELGAMINDSSNNGFFAQAKGSVYVQMALMQAVMG